ncbi:MAG: adenylate/guanylate cyclase domain-containing protein [Anaerolineales bacterium]|nr:MAG: adenylate/guanylate cyclase domain-containing protein [Anaerolineales bacterium]
MTLPPNGVDEEINNLTQQNQMLRRRIDALERNQRELENRILQLRTLYEIGTETASMFEPAKILQVILSRVMGAFDATTGLALTVSETDNEWSITLQQGYTQREWTAVSTKFVPQTLQELYYSWSTERSPSAPRWLVLSEAEGESPFVDWIRQLDIRIWLPFTVNHLLIGGVGLGRRMGQNDFSSGDLMLLSGIIDNSVERIKSARLLDTLLHEQQELYRTRGIFEQFMAPQVVDQLLDGQLKLSMEGHRREVTVLVADLRRSTELVLRLETEEMVRLLNDYFGEITNIVFSYEGMVDKFLGDGVMAVFGAPIAHREGELDDATRAVQAALEMQNVLKGLLNSWEKRLGHTLETGLGIGVCTGTAVVGNVGSVKRVEHTVIGPVVYLASRLSKLATSGQTLIDEETYRCMSLPIGAEPLKPVAVKGFSRSVPVYKLTGGLD